MAEDKGHSKEFDSLPESELDEVVGGLKSPLLASQLPSSLYIKSLKPVGAKDFSKVTAALCLYDDPR